MVWLIEILVWLNKRRVRPYFSVIFSEIGAISFWTLLQELSMVSYYRSLSTCEASYILGREVVSTEFHHDCMKHDWPHCYSSQHVLGKKNTWLHQFLFFISRSQIQFNRLFLFLDVIGLVMAALYFLLFSYTVAGESGSLHGWHIVWPLNPTSSDFWRSSLILDNLPDMHSLFNAK